jgi:hypothetical protein
VSEGGKSVHVTGLVELVAQLKGPAFRDVNQAMRPMARSIADELRPHVELALRLSPAPQAKAMAGTVRTKSDRVPVMVIGATNPKFSAHKFTHKGETARQRKLRRGSLAHGVIFGPKGGKRSTAADENYYAPQQRDDSGGPLMRSMRTGALYDRAVKAYMDGYLHILTHYGFVMDSGGQVHWGGGR